MGTKVMQKLPIILNPIIEDIIRQTDRLAFEGAGFLQDYFDRLYCSPVVLPILSYAYTSILVKGMANLLHMTAYTISEVRTSLNFHDPPERCPPTFSANRSSIIITHYK
jgi:hypothetical protein